MKRWPLRIMLCLIVGAITTVAVAWGIAWRSEESGVAATTPAASWPRKVPSHWPQPKEQGSYSSIGYSQLATKATSYKDGRIDGHFMQRLHRFGLPFHAAEYEVQFVYDQLGQPREGRVLAAVGRYQPTPEIKPIAVVPIRLIWSGFLLDTLFYAVISGGLYLAVTTLKRFIRTKRGRCPCCGYDLRGAFHNGCSECGWKKESNR